MTYTRPFKLRANEDHTMSLSACGLIEDVNNNYLSMPYFGFTSSEDAHIFQSNSEWAVKIINVDECYEKVYLDELPQSQEPQEIDNFAGGLTTDHISLVGDIINDCYNLSRNKYELSKSNPDTTVNLGETITNKFTIQAQPKHADDLISYGMTIPGEIFVYVPSPDKPIDDNNPLCFVSEDKASKFSSWPEGVSRACFFPEYHWVSVQLPGTIETTKIVGELTMGSWSVCDPSEDKHEETNMKSLDKYIMKSLDKYLLDLQSDMLHLSEAIVAALECLRESSEENNDSFVKAYNKYRSKRGQTVLGED